MAKISDPPRSLRRRTARRTQKSGPRRRADALDATHATHATSLRPDIPFCPDPGSLAGAVAKFLGDPDLDVASLPPHFARRLAQEIAKREEVERALRESLRELRNKEDQLRRSEGELQQVMDALPALVSYVDARQCYRFVSAAYERWFGHPKADVIGRHLRDVLGPEAYRAIAGHVQRALAGELVSYEAELPYRAGGKRFIEARYVPQFVAGEVGGFVALVSDVTERKQFERFRAAAAARAERLLQLTAAIADAVSEAQVHQAVVDRAAQAVAASSAALWLVDQDGARANLVRSLGYSPEVQQRFASVALDSEPSIPLIDCIRSGELIWISSQQDLIRDYPQLRSIVNVGLTYRVVCLPLIAHRRVLGSLSLTMAERLDSSEAENDFLLLVARYASQALERLRLFEAERRSRAKADAAAVHMGVLSHASRMFVESGPELEARVRSIVAELGMALQSCAGVSLLQDDGRLHTLAVYHPEAEATRMLLALRNSAPLHLGEGIAGKVAATGASVLLAAPDAAQIAERSAPAYRTFLERYPIHALLCVPLRVDGRVIGTVTASRTAAGQQYDADDLRLCQELAERAATALENARLYQGNLDARSRAEQLYRFAQAAVAADRVEQVFEAALGAIEAALDTRRAAILTQDLDGVMRFRASSNLSERYRDATEGHSPWPADALAPEPVLVSDVQHDAALVSYMPYLRSEGIRALAFIPLITHGRLLGKLTIYYDQPHHFAAHEVETARALANHLASVVSRFAAVATLQDTIRSNELFAGVLAHDLRNPLGAIVTAAQLMAPRHEGEPDKRERNKKRLARILSSGERMTRMIDQLLDFTRARAGGGIDIQPRESDLGELCAQAVGELELAHPEWKIRHELTGDLHGTWDPDRLLQVISNLVANAGQHGHEGGIIAVRLDGSRPDLVSIGVHNQGVVPGSLLPHLFDPFRGTRHTRAGSRGLGLGLFIVRELLRTHGGKVEVASSEGDGTTFSIQLPRHHTRIASPSANK